MKSAACTLKSTGEKFLYNYKDSWNSRYYSFDNGLTWNKSRFSALIQSKPENRWKVS